MKRALKGLLASIALVTVAQVQAGMFSTHVFSGRISDGGQVIKDLVGDNFTNHYPSNAWTIVIISSSYKHTNGGGMAHAIVGLAPKSENTTVPLRRWSSYRDISGKKQLSQSQLADLEALAIHDATDAMMSECSVNSKCKLTAN